DRPCPIRSVAEVRERQVAAPDFAFRAGEASSAAGAGGRKVCDSGQRSGDRRLSWIDGGSVLVEDSIDSVESEVTVAGAVGDARHVAIAEEGVADAVGAVVGIRIQHGIDFFTSSDRAIPGAAGGAGRCQRIHRVHASFLASTGLIRVAKHSVFGGIHGSGERFTQVNLNWAAASDYARVAIGSTEQSLRL